MASQSRFDFLDGPSADRPLLDKFVVGQTGNELVLDQAGPRPIDPLGSLSVNRPSGSEQQGTSLVMGGSSWRRGRDLNPRRSYKPLTRLAGERLRPLGHLSKYPAVTVPAEGVGFEPTRPKRAQRFSRPSP